MTKYTRPIPSEELFRAAEKHNLRLYKAIWFAPYKTRAKVKDPLTGEIVKSVVRPYVIVTRRKAVIAPPDQPAMRIISALLSSK